MSIAQRIRAAVPFLLAIVASLFLYKLTLEFPPPPGTGRIGADVWPRLILGLMLLAALWGGAQAMLSGAGPNDEDALARLAAASGGAAAEGDAPAPETAPARTSPYIPAAGMAALLGYVGLLPYVGFTIATFALMLAIMLLGGYRRPRSAVLIAALGALGFFAVFQRLVYVSLPLGVEPFKSFSTALMALIGVR